MLYSGNVDILEYTSGSVFRGICEERKPSKGVYQSVKGDMYIGDYDVDSKFCGFGMYKFANDSLYVGNFYKGLYDGVGVEIRSNGDIVFAKYSRDRIDGLCVVYSEGNWRWYKREGDKLVSTDAPYQISEDFGIDLKTFRVAELSNGDTYIGFKDENGKYSGWGIYRYKNVGVYIGEFSENNFYGYGCRLFSDGNVLLGSFSDDKFEDGITFLSEDNYVKVTDRILSECAIVFSDGTTYEGGYDTETGRYAGQGTYTWPCGTRYQGWWKDGLQFGRGTYIYSNGHCEEGVWIGNEEIAPETETYKQLCRYCDGPSFWERLFTNLPKIIIGLTVAVIIAKLGGRVTDIIKNSTKNFSPRVPGLSSATCNAISYTGNVSSRQFKNGCIRTNLQPLHSHLSNSILFKAKSVFDGFTNLHREIKAPWAGGGSCSTLKVFKDRWSNICLSDGKCKPVSITDSTIVTVGKHSYKVSTLKKLL